MPRASSRNRHLVPDLLAPGLDLVFCGTAPSPASFKARAYYANPGNAFWPTLHAVGLTPERFSPERYPELLTLGIGLTDLNKTEYGSDHELSAQAMDAARAACQAAPFPAGRHRLHQQARRRRWRSASRRRPTDGRPNRSKARSPSCSPRRRAAPARSGRSSRGARPRPSSPSAGRCGSARHDHRTPHRARRRAGLALGLALAAPAIVHAQEAAASLRDLARRATIYLFPVYEMYRTRWQATVNEANPLRQRLNRFRHLPQLADHRARAVTTPNHDTLYSSAWLDLSLEPLFLTVPPVGDLYYSYAFIDLFTNNFAYVSHRLHGGQPPPHMIVGPNWNGDASSEVKLLRAPTNSVWLIGRILVDGPEELDRVRILQARVLLETPDMSNERRILETRELMRQRTVAPPEPVADWAGAQPRRSVRPLRGRRAGAGREPAGRARPCGVREPARRSGCGPGASSTCAPSARPSARAIQAGIEQGHAEIRAAASRAGKTIDGWTYGERHLGNFGDDYLYRARDRAHRAGRAGAGRSRLRRPATPTRAAGRCRAPTATNSPSRPTACRRCALSGRSPCTR